MKQWSSWLSNLYCTAATVLGVGSQLQICHLSDGITNADAAQFLPTSLQELHLTYSTFDDCIYNSMYRGIVSGESDDSDTSDDGVHGSILAGCERLCNLCKLCIEFEDPACSLLLCRLTHVMPKLQHFEVYGAKLVAEEGRRIAELLPQIEFLKATVYISKEENSTQQAQDLLQYVPRLMLRIMGQSTPVPNKTNKFTSTRQTLTVTESSRLQVLELWSHFMVRLTLIVEKAIELQTNNVVSVQRVYRIHPND